LTDTTITGRIGGRLATMADYRNYFADVNRPHKFSAQEVDFQFPAAGSAHFRYQCGACWHYFSNATGEREVCEIMRLDPERNVPAGGTCCFWNRDGKFPLLRAR
jgi:hypothetical protein